MKRATVMKSPFVLAILVVTTGLGSMSQSGCATPRPSHHLVQAERRVDSRLARELTEKGLVAFDTGDLAEAERLFREAVDVDVAFGPAHNNLGKVYFELEKMYLAAWEFEYAIKLMPHHPGPRNNLGLVLELSLIHI